MATVTVTGLAGMPEVRADDDLTALVLAACEGAGMTPLDGDVFVVSSKVVSKSLGLWAETRDRQAAVEGQTVRVVAERVAGDRLTRIVRSTSGPVMAAAGVDGSNTGGVDGLLLLPADPDAEADRLRVALLAATGLTRLGVVVSDTSGRPWRVGQTDFALGASGVAVVDDLRGGVDADGAALHVTTRAVADELAAAAELVKGKVDRVPVALVRGSGLATTDRGPGARALLRVGREDWFDHGRAEAVRSSLGVEPGTAEAADSGIPSVAPEPAPVRVDRAVRVASAGLPHDCEVDTTQAGVVEVAADTAYRAGLVAARVAVALWGEGFAAQPDTEPVIGDGGAARAQVAYTER